ncbi:MAG TPA: tetratricopeptide repeat protein [Streptosporangiaceae bacterium]|nr:tetratricopeptide repeat protein [Streptosporangiaceae bacterium]
MPSLTREEFDAIEFEAALTGDHQAAAERMSQLAATGTATESMGRAEAYVRVGEQWLLADDPGAAAKGFRKAIAAGGPVDVDPRIPLCRALFQLGERDQAYELIAALKAEGGADARACDMITELLVEQSDLPAALDWATAGVELMLSGQPDAEEAPPPQVTNGAVGSGLRDLLRLRYRIRNDLRLPEDEYDRMLGS